MSTFGSPTLAPLLVASLLASCTTGPPSTPRVDAPESIALVEPALRLVPVARYGRYTLVELTPEPTQRDLMQQVVDIAIPPAFDVTVGEALRHVLLRSGYRLCDTPEAAALYALPLPAAHLRLGPLMLRDALLTLTGPAWDPQVDDGARQVCFVRAVPPTLHLEGPPLPEPDNVPAAETFPIKTEGRL